MDDTTLSIQFISCRSLQYLLLYKVLHLTLQIGTSPLVTLENRCRICYFKFSSQRACPWVKHYFPYKLHMLSIPLANLKELDRLDFSSNPFTNFVCKKEFLQVNFFLSVFFTYSSYPKFVTGFHEELVSKNKVNSGSIWSQISQKLKIQLESKNNFWLPMSQSLSPYKKFTSKHAQNS